MRVVQIIDSLEIGGAERMAVNYANSLSKNIEFSALIATRKEGFLLEEIDPNVSYLFLSKKKIFDIKAIFKVRSFIKKNKIDIVHAHGSSFFIAILAKFTLFKTKIIWHDHLGLRISQSKKQNRILVFFSVFFESIFSVNNDLANWSIKNLKCKNVTFVPNFILENKNEKQVTNLKGSNGKRIVFLANLKTPKNHKAILFAFSNLKLFESGWSLHLIGKDYFDQYSTFLKDYLKNNNLENHVFLYDTKSDIKFILSQAEIGVLASTFEGFPVTLIEYGFAGLAVLSTNAGYCAEIINNGENGLLFDPLNEVELVSKLNQICSDEILRKKLALNLKYLVDNTYTESVIIKKIMSEYRKIL